MTAILKSLDTSALEVLYGDDAIAAIKCDDFKNAWSKLYLSCPWASEFQSWAFLSTWYDVYAERHEPILIVSRNQNGDLSGILALARHRASGSIFVAGGGQAEYHGWLATEPNKDIFIIDALNALARECSAPIQLVNLLDNVPANCFTAPGELKDRCVTKIETRPLMDISDPEKISKILRKKHNRSRLNGLKRRGNLEFKELTDWREFQACFDEIARIFDRRQKVHHGIEVFHDPLNRRFPLEYARRHPEQVKIFTMTLDGAVVAALIGQVCGDALAFDTIAFDLDYEEYSPASLLIYMAARELSGGAIRFLDLTPGGDWKARFQTDSKTSMTVTVFPNRTSAALASGKATLKATAKRILSVLPVAFSPLRKTSVRRPG